MFTFGRGKSLLTSTYFTTSGESAQSLLTHSLIYHKYLPTKSWIIILAYILIYVHTKSVIFMRREYIPLLPIAETEPRGPIDPPFYPEAAPPGWWRENTTELFAAAAQISYIMRDLAGLGIALHTPFTGLCVFTAALMNRYAVTFPHMLLPLHQPEAEKREHHRQLGVENLADLEAIARLWPLGAEWVQVIGAAQGLYDRLLGSSSSSNALGRCRCEYPDLVNSVTYAPLGGMYAIRGVKNHCRCLSTRYGAHSTSTTTAATSLLDSSAAAVAAVGNVPCLRSCVARTAHRLQEEGEQEPPDMETFAGHEMDGMGGGDDDWRLWSFWDDPHLLSWDTSTMGI